MKKSSSKKRKLLILLFCLILLPVLLILLAVQPFFIRSVILPQVEKATDSQISVESLQLAPFSRLSLTGLQFQSNDQSVKIQAATATLRYDLMAMLKGTMVVNEFTLLNPEIQYDATVATGKAEAGQDAGPEAGPETETATAQPPQLQIRNVNLVNGVVDLILPEGTLHIADLNFRLPELFNGQPIRPTLEARFSGSTHAQPDQQFMEGFVDARVEVALSDHFVPTGLKGTLEAVIGENQAGLPEMKLKGETDLKLDMDQGLLGLEKLSVIALRGGRPLLSLNLSNPAEVQWLQNPPVFTDCQISLELPQVEIPSLPFTQLLPIQSGLVFINSQLTVSDSGKKMQADLDFGVQRLVLPGTEDSETFSVGNFTGKGALAWQQGQDIEAAFQLDAENIKLPDGKTLPSPLNLKIETVATSAQAQLNTFEFGWAETAGFTNRLQVTGDLNWKDPQALSGQLKIRGQQLDLDPWSAFLESRGAEPATDLAVQAESPREPLTFSFPELPLQNLGLDLAVTKIHYQNMEIQQLLLKADAASRQLSISPLSFEVNGSTFSSTALADWTQPIIQIDLNAALSPLDLQPIVDSFLPEKQGAVTGILQGNTDFKLRGTDLQTLWDSFQGAMNVAYTDGKLRLINADPEQNTALFHTRKLVQDVVTGMAEALKLDPAQLMEPEIESVIFNSTLENKQLLLRKVEILNPEFLMEAQGEILLKTEIGQSQIMQLPVVLGLGTNLAKRVKIYRTERVKGAHVLLPAFLEVTGTLEASEIKIKKGVLTGLVISGVTENVNVGNENVQTGLNILGTLLTGEAAPVKPTPTPAPLPPGASPSPTPKPSKADQVLEGFRIFQELRATPIPKP